jgi:hypothetical protein
MTAEGARKRFAFLWATVMLATMASGARGDETSAIAALKKMDDSVEITRDENRPGKPVIEIRIGPDVTNEGLKELAELKHLQSLTIHTICRNVDAGLKGLSGLQDLRSVDVSTSPVTEVG